MSRRSIVAFLVTVLMVAVVGVVPAGAHVSWCSSDPVVTLPDGSVVNVVVEAPVETRDDIAAGRQENSIDGGGFYHEQVRNWATACGVAVAGGGEHIGSGSGAASLGAARAPEHAGRVLQPPCARPATPALLPYRRRDSRRSPPEAGP